MTVTSPVAAVTVPICCVACASWVVVGWVVSGVSLPNAGPVAGLGSVITFSPVAMLAPEAAQTGATNPHSPLWEEATLVFYADKREGVSHTCDYESWNYRPLQ